MGSFIAWLIAKGVSPRFARPAAYAALIVLALVAIRGGVWIHDRSVIAQHNAKMAAKIERDRAEQAERERKADAALQAQQRRDDAAAQQRRKDIDHATLNLSDQAPSARQRARACIELRRQAAADGRAGPAC